MARDEIDRANVILWTLLLCALSLIVFRWGLMGVVMILKIALVGGGLLLLWLIGGIAYIGWSDWQWLKRHKRYREIDV